MSIRRINASISVQGTLRDLNHRIEAYRDMARITLCDWMCQMNECVCPMSQKGQTIRTREFGHSAYLKKLPIGWLNTHEFLQGFKGGAEVRSTDQSPILDGDVSLAHIAKQMEAITNQIKAHTLKPTPAGEPYRDATQQHEQPRSKAPPKSTLSLLHQRGYTWLKDMGQWGELGTMEMPETPHLPQKMAKSAEETAKKRFNEAKQWLRTIPISTLANGPLELVLPRRYRMIQANAKIKAYGTRAENVPATQEPPLWATDGGMKPAAAKMHQDRKITASVAGPKSSIWRLIGRSKGIVHGEVFALIIAHLLNEDQNATIVSDHLNAVKMINHAPNEVEEKLNQSHARSWYRWLLEIRKEQPATVAHIRSHTGKEDERSQMNKRADSLASEGLRQWENIPMAPEPTFMMDDFVVHTNEDGYVESGIQTFVQYHLAYNTAIGMDRENDLRMNRTLFEAFDIPEHPYTRGVSAYSAEVQLFIRSGQLDTMATRQKRKLSQNNGGQCEFGCQAYGDAHHIFVTCPRFQDLRVEVTEELETSTIRMMSDEEGDEWKQSLTRIATHLLEDADTWPTHRSKYYYGMLPKMRHLIPRTIPTKRRNQLFTRMAAEWHTLSIRLTGRIWGAIQKERTRIWKAESGRDWKK